MRSLSARNRAAAGRGLMGEGGSAPESEDANAGCAPAFIPQIIEERNYLRSRLETQNDKHFPERGCQRRIR